MCASSESESDEEDNPPRSAVGARVQGRAGTGQDACPDDTVLLISRQRVLQADWEKLRKFLGRLRSAVSRQPFSVCLISDRAMRRYNKQYRHQDQATDVLSFPAEKDSAAPGDYLGDILISVETARENAARFGVKLEDEIKLLALHGVLHLMGYDHETDRGQMARAERRWCGRLGLPAPLTMRSPKQRRVAAAGGRD